MTLNRKDPHHEAFRYSLDRSIFFSPNHPGDYGRTANSSDQGYDEMVLKFNKAKSAPGSVIVTYPDGRIEVYTHQTLEDQRATLTQLKQARLPESTGIRPIDRKSVV